MNLSVAKAESMNTLSWRMLLEQQANGQIVAWVAELPDCRVVAESREAAIGQLEALIEKRMAGIDAVEFQPRLNSFTPAEHPALKFIGIFKDDPDFTAWHDRLWAEKQRNKDDDEILSIEECLQVM
ncbi:MAG: hypothetical protein RLZZ511_3944 [Cyanobacteriota bacterium]|jgi:predicted RNase H-like HicB family nuclease